MFAKRFFYVCAGLFLLALSYHFGAQTATAQAPGNPVVATFAATNNVITANGDVYQPGDGTPCAASWSRCGNIFGSGPTPARAESFGALKSRYRGERGAAQPAQNR